MVKKTGATRIDDALKDKLDDVWKMMSAEEIRAGIKNTLDNLGAAGDFPNHNRPLLSLIDPIRHTEHFRLR